MSCDKTTCITCGTSVKKCNTINGECKTCAGKKKQ